MRVVRTGSRVLLLILAATLLAACGKKPPECAEQEAVQALRKFMDDSVVEGMRFKGVDTKQDAGGLIPKYLATWAFELSNVTSQGFDDKSRTRTCKGTVSVTIPDAKVKAARTVEYDMQMLEDPKSGGFQLRVDRGFQNWATALAPPAVKHFQVNRFSGDWVGTAQCGATEVKRDPYQPFAEAVAGQGFSDIRPSQPWLSDGAVSKTPVKVTIQAGAVTMTITKQDNTTSVRTGELGEDGSFQFRAEDEMKSAVGLNWMIRGDAIGSLPPYWVAVPAKVKANATGDELDAVLVRTCELALKKQ